MIIVVVAITLALCIGVAQLIGAVLGWIAHRRSQFWLRYWETHETHEPSHVNLLPHKPVDAKSTEGWDGDGLLDVEEL